MKHVELTDNDLLRIIHQAIAENAIDCGDAYLHFLEDLAELVADHFGGEAGEVMAPIPDAGVKDYNVTIYGNECVPEDGWVYRQFEGFVGDNEVPI